MGRIGPFGVWELLLILVLVLLLFGAKRLPEMAKGIGQAIKEFRGGIKEVQSDIEGTGKPSQPSGKDQA